MVIASPIEGARARDRHGERSRQRASWDDQRVMDLATHADHAVARLGGRVATGLRDLTSDPAALDSSGWWAVVVTFEGAVTCARFEDVRPASGSAGHLASSGRWRGPATDTWSSSLDRDEYVAAVERVRARIALGDVYQANVCRVLEATLPDAEQSDLAGLATRLVDANPAPHAGHVRLPGAAGRAPIDLVTASPELFLRRDGRALTSRPIKGTGRTEVDITDKDRAENVMIVDLVRNDLGAVSETGSVEVPGLCEVENHPGLVHLVSTVRSRLRDGAGWPELFAAAFPPGSVTGAPKLRALEVLREIEPVPRGPYCGAVGWVDADSGIGELAVAIRTFWREDDRLLFGTGAGITWGSDAAREWEETELKAKHLLAVAAGGAT
jgi:para-aminobenzoate synthetase component 1